MQSTRSYRHTIDGIRYVVGPWYSYGEPAAEDLPVLRLLSEQVAMPVDQLSAFTGKSIAGAAALADRLSVHGWVQLALFPGEDHEWMWLRSGGVLRAGTPFGYHHPTATSLAHRRALNDARLRLEAEYPQGTWICERGIRLQSKVGLIPDAAFIHDGSTWAIEVEISVRTREHARRKLDELLQDYDGVRVVCSARTLPGFQRLSQRYEQGRVVAQPSRVEPPPVRGVRRRGRPVGDYRPTQLEVSALRFISEEGSVSTERLARLLQIDIDRARNLAEDLLHVGAIRAACGDGVHSGWFWCNYRGARVAGLGLYPMRGDPRPARFVKREILTDARIQLRERFPDGRWLGPRLLQSMHVIPEPFPQAMLEDVQARYAVEVITGPWNRARARDRVALFVNRFDGVICVCAEDVLADVEELVEQREWTNVQPESLERQ